MAILNEGESPQSNSIHAKNNTVNHFFNLFFIVDKYILI